jgi:conjugative relaxase-like TrwC/TraI family protein
MRVTTLYAATAATTARYYTRYLSDAPGESPGVWLGRQAEAFGLSGTVSTEALEAVLSGHEPATGAVLGRPFLDRITRKGTVVRAVAGFDATVSAPKSLSVLWALTGDEGLAACHDVAVGAVVDYLERFGSTTRVRTGQGMSHPDTHGLTVAAFRQSTSRADDPQLHTHLVISSKVQTEDGRWWALDARVLKRHQRALGGLYQSVLRAELTGRYGLVFEPIVNGQAEIAGVPREVIEVFSKRAAQVAEALELKLAEFWIREGRDPDPIEHAALEREAAVDTRVHKSGLPTEDLQERWGGEAAQLGITAHSLLEATAAAVRRKPTPGPTAAADIVSELSAWRSAWHRMDVLRVLCDRQPPVSGISGHMWATWLDQSIEHIVDHHCVSLDPPDHHTASTRASDGRSLWLEPVSASYSSAEVLAQEETILTWAFDAQLEDPQPSTTLDPTGLDVLQAAAAAAVAGEDRLVLIVGPAGAGKTTMLRAAVRDFHDVQHRPISGLAPTAKAAIVLWDETGMVCDTVAKVVYECVRPDPGSDYPLPQRGETVVVDEAGMLSTPDLYRLVQLATERAWRLVLVGDPRQLQAVRRGGMFAELCGAARTIELDRLHRFDHEWEARASLCLRNGDTRVLDAYEAHGRIRPGLLVEHLEAIADAWIDTHRKGESLAITTTTNDHVDAVNEQIQQRRLELGELDPTRCVGIAGGAVAHVGDVVVTRRNDRSLATSADDFVRNRELWTVVEVGATGLVGRRRRDGAMALLPADYVLEHVQLGYSATEPGNQADTSTRSITLVTRATTGRGLYVGMTRGREENLALVATGNHDSDAARDLLEHVIVNDHGDVPALSQRRELAREIGTRSPPDPSLAAMAPPSGGIEIDF